MFLATINKPRQLLVTHYIEDVGPDELARSVAEVRQLLASLSPGFTLLVDLSQLHSMDPDCARPIGEIMEQLVAAGVGRVIRVIPDVSKDIGFNILGIFHYPKELSVTNHATFKEAITFLAP